MFLERECWISFCYGMNKPTVMCCTVLVRQGLQRKAVEQMFFFRSLLLKTLSRSKAPFVSKSALMP